MSLAVLLCFSAVSFTLEAAPIRRNARKIKDQYLVMLKPEFLPSLEATAAAIALEHSGRVRKIFKRAFVGFSVDLTDAQALRLANHPAVELLEENAGMDLSATATDALPDVNDWGLDRIDQVTGLNGAYTYCTTRHPSLSDSNPVLVYVFDGGVDRDHKDFFYLDWQPHLNDYYRVSWTGYDFVWHSEQGAVNPYVMAEDGYCGSETFVHGTAVASLIARTDRQAFIVPVRVVGPCFRQPSDFPVERLLEAVEYIIIHAPQGRTHVANFSVFLEGDRAPSTVDSAITNMVNRNIVVVTSANNQNANRCATQTPARVPAAITVGATQRDPMDRRVSGLTDPFNPGSNYGECVDIFAPGHSMRLAAISSSVVDAYTVSPENVAATSYAAALVSGAAARYLEQNPTATPAQVWSYLKANAVHVVSDGRSPNAQDNPNWLHARLVNARPECP